MISFFRKIRQKLLEEKRMGNYLKYALGEIFLVVIGILIALMINSAYENKKDRNLEVKYLEGIATNLEDDINELERQILDDSLQLSGYTRLVRAFQVDSIKSDQDGLIRTIFNIQLISSFEGNNIVFEDLKSSGRTNLIKSDSLRYHILRFYNQAQILIQAEKELHNPVILAERNSLFISDQLGINKTENLFFPEYWSAQLSPRNATDLFSFLNEDISSPKVQLFANRAGYIKALIFAKRRERIRLLNAAISMKKEIEDFLGNLSH
ncbi:hypothetical protein DFQ04_1668 [Algoriphagus boseongensis]|uniref:Uncharacterized protein n=1 Tax=Algoriphagus boseongensis TaxID=1442587 RepID=A0A4V6PW48_9BACT|nr:hypothetical protein [Algoriphagus boseongensis]TDQ17020.1 hypothetical protein DFQ04_1668 [Algoriphagus boseongensis]